MKLSREIRQLEAEAIYILRDGIADAERPVLLFSGGKDSTVLGHLARKAFFPGHPPMPLLHVDSTWEFQDVLDFRDRFASAYGFELTVYANEEGRARGLNPIDHGEVYTTTMRTDALKKALDAGRYDVIFGGARRDEEATRAKERVASIRGDNHSWDPRQQRPELWMNFNWRRAPGQTIRAFPLSNWTELDLWRYIVSENIELSPLYYARPRRVVQRSGTLIVVDDPDRWPWSAPDQARLRSVRFRTLGCWPVTGAVESNASSAMEILEELTATRSSERGGRVSDGRSLEGQKREGYF
ncbi:MAG: sulfate adenylyltransferase subunit CysD [Hyphomicrobiaceae bacterium]